MRTADSLARIDLMALGCLIGAAIIFGALAALVLAERLLPRVPRLPRRKDRP